jgi:hypothetical protein
MRSIERSVNGVGYRSLALNSEAGLHANRLLRRCHLPGVPVMPSRFRRGDGVPRYNGNGSSPTGHYCVYALVRIRVGGVA